MVEQRTRHAPGPTVREQAALTSGADLWSTEAVPRLGVEAVLLSDGPHGLRVQRGETDHLGIEASLPATCFPPAVTLASSWDPHLLRTVGAALGEEASALGVGLVLGPGMNLKRDPRCGRNFEYTSEDPLLTALLAAPMVEGIQSAGVGACIKHFAVNNQETDRLRVDVVLDERTLRETYLRAFEYVVRTARPWGVMSAYNRIGGEYASEHHRLLTTILRDEWGFDGVVVSDWGAVMQRERSLLAGLDLVMPAPGAAEDQALAEAVESGRVDPAALERAARRVIQLAERVAAGRTGRANGQAAGSDGPGRGRLSPELLARNHQVARRAATESAVLLTNDGTLPIGLADCGTIAVLGEFARTPRFQGAGSSQVTAHRVDSALDALRLRVGADRTRFAPGFLIDETDAPPEAHTRLREEAVGIAGSADIVLVFLGLPPSAESEGYDRSELGLPQHQLDLLRAVTDAGHRPIVVLSNGGVVTMADWITDCAAVLETWLTGQAGGEAVVDLLAGVHEPSGRLAETIPVRLEDVPSYLSFPGEAGRLTYAEGVFVGYRGHDALGRAVSFPFGHGLGYTRFTWQDPAVAAAPDGAFDVSITVTNVGERDGHAVVQVYAEPPSVVMVGTPRRPLRELVGFRKVSVERDRSERVTISVPRDRLARYRTDVGAFAVDDGEHRFHIGASSRDLRASVSATVAGDAVTVPVGPMSTLAEWRAHPRLGPALEHLVATRGGATGRLGDLLGTPHGRFAIEAKPLRSLVFFPGYPISVDDVDRLLDEVGADA